MAAAIASFEVCSQYDVLHDIVQRHEELVRKRWLKRSREQRKRLLLAVRPDMSAHHRPDFRVYSQECQSKASIRGPRAFEAFAFPSINLEDLLEGKNFLLFLGSRARHHPEAFVQVDRQTVSLGKAVGPISTAYLPGYTMMLRGQTAPDDYGRLVSWETDARAREYYESGMQEGFGVGLLVLTIQATVLDFLTRCCCQLLQESPAELLQADVKPAPAAIEPSGTQRPSMAAIIAETPYRVPPLDPDLDRILAIVDARRSALRDHICALREDPGYFAEVVADFADHRPERLPAVAGATGPPRDSPAFWHKTLEDVLQRAYFAMHNWNVFYDLLAQLAQVQRKHGGPFAWDSRIPDEFSHAVVRLVCFCYRLSHVFLKHLEKHLPASPPMRAKFVRRSKAFSCGCCGTRPKGAATKPSDILWVFELLQDPQKALELGLSNILDEYDRRLRRDPKQKDLITPLVDGALADLVVVAESIRQLEMMPWAVQANRYAHDHRATVDAELDALEAVLRAFDAQLQHVSLADVGRPSGHCFHYPVDRRRTRETTDQLRRAERRLDAFWDTVDAGLAGGVCAFVASVSPTRDQLQRTAAWVEPAPPEAKPAPPEDPQPAYVPLEHLAIHDAVNPPRSSDPVTPAPPPKAKTKTRGTPHAPAAPPASTATKPAGTLPHPPAALREPAPAPPDARPARARIPVGKRALAAFAFVFPVPARAYAADGRAPPAGELPWVDFLHAMSRAGFALEKLHGSAWQFTPVAAPAVAADAADATAVAPSGGSGAGGGGDRGVAATRPIQFHEPHPGAKIPFLWGRRMGRRLQRAFGWGLETFELEGK